MRILLSQPNCSEEKELTEFFQSNACEVFVANQPKEVYQLLAMKEIDAVLYRASNIDDFHVIRYINNTYPKVIVVVTSETSLCKSIENVRKGEFVSLQQPYHLYQLNELFINHDQVKE